MTVYAYRRPSGARNSPGDFEHQQEAIRAICKLQNLTISNGCWKEEVGPETEIATAYLLGEGGAKSGDVVVFATPSVLHPNPIRALDIASQLVGKGVRLVVASGPGGNLDLAGLRANLQPLEAQQKIIEDLKAQLAEAEQEHQKDFAEYQKALEAQTMKLLKDRGVTLAQLLKPSASLDTGESDIQRPDEGKRLRSLREGLGFSGEFAGKLLDPPIDKSAVSKIEAFGSGAARYEDYRSALLIEQGLKHAREIKRSQGIADAVKRPQKAEQVIKKAVADASAGVWQPEVEVDAKSVALARQRNLEERI